MVRKISDFSPMFLFFILYKKNKIKRKNKNIGEKSVSLYKPYFYSTVNIILTVYTQHTAPHRRCSSSLKPSPPTRRTSISTVYRTENVTQAAEMSDTESSNNGYNNTISKGIYSSTTSVPTG